MYRPISTVRKVMLLRNSKQKKMNWLGRSFNNDSPKEPIRISKTGRRIGVLARKVTKPRAVKKVKRTRPRRIA